MPTTPSKEAQAAEGAARAESGNTIPAGETALATATIGDVAPPDGARAAPAAPAAEGEARPAPPVRSLNDEKRAAITARFRTDRTVEAEGDGDDISSFTRSAGLPPEFAESHPVVALPEPEPEPQPEPEPGAEPAPGPQMVTVKVHGKEIQIPIEEAIAKAQIALASENILDEAKTKARELDAILADARNRAAMRPAPDGANQTVQHQAQPGSPQPPTVQPDQEDPFKKLIETIQFGDPDEAKQLFQQTIGATAQQIVHGQLLESRFKDEGARAAKVLKDFETAHPEIATDRKARAAIESDILDQQEGDLRNIGIDPARIRADGLPPTPGDIADAHRYFRVEQGLSLSTPQQMLEKAATNYLEWKGPKEPAAPAPGSPKVPPRVEVTVDRAARRQAIPQQPSVTAAPRAAPAQPAQPRDRSDIVNAMKERSAKRRGQTIGL